MYRIETKCSFEELYRYSTTIMCGGYSSSSKELYVVSAKDSASMGEEFSLPQITTLETRAADNIRVEIYVVPHTLSDERRVTGADPFELDVKITRKGKIIHSQNYPVNRWGGASIEIKLYIEKP